MDEKKNAPNPMAFKLIENLISQTKGQMPPHEGLAFVQGVIKGVIDLPERGILSLLEDIPTEQLPEYSLIPRDIIVLLDALDEREYQIKFLQEQRGFVFQQKASEVPVSIDQHKDAWHMNESDINELYNSIKEAIAALDDIISDEGRAVLDADMDFYGSSYWSTDRSNPILTEKHLMVLATILEDSSKQLPAHNRVNYLLRLKAFSGKRISFGSLSHLLAFISVVDKPVTFEIIGPSSFTQDYEVVKMVP